MKRYFALCGLPGAGKSEVQKILWHDHQVIPVDDARPLRDAAKVLYNLTEEDVTTQHGKARVIQVGERHITVREVLGELGNYVEATDMLHLPKLARLKADEMHPGCRVSFGSVRRNQGEVFRGAEGLVIEVVRDGIDLINEFDAYDTSLVDIRIHNKFDSRDVPGSLERLRMEIAQNIGPFLKRPALSQ